MDIEKMKKEAEKNEKEREFKENFLLELLEMVGGGVLAKLHRIEMQEEKLRKLILEKYVTAQDDKLDKEKVNKIEKVFSDNLKNLQDLEKELED